MAETISQVLTLVRDVTQQRGLSETILLEYVNSFYQNQFHIDIGMQPIETMWNFQTLANEDEYAISESYRLINSKYFQINGQPRRLFFSKLEFDTIYEDAYILEEPIGSVTRTVTSESFATGDGGTSYASSSTNTNIIAGSLIVNDVVGAQTLTDDGVGGFTGDGTGTVDYTSGSISVTFNANVALGNAITIDYQYTAIGVGDGATTNFTGTLTKMPVVPKSLFISDGLEVFKDVDGVGTLASSLFGSTGTINYLTGVYDVTFATAPIDGVEINATYAEYTAAQPCAALYYDNTIKFRPIPDASYDINIQVAKRPTELTSISVLPNVLWGDAIAYGTAVDIQNRYGNEADALFAERQYKKKLGAILGHEYKIKSSTQRAIPRW